VQASLDNIVWAGINIFYVLLEFSCKSGFVADNASVNSIQYFCTVIGKANLKFDVSEAKILRQRQVFSMISYDSAISVQVFAY
jgi:hypothetical protein